MKQAIEADQSGDYERALSLYKRSLEYFMTGLKYEQNPAAKATIMQVTHDLKLCLLRFATLIAY